MFLIKRASSLEEVALKSLRKLALTAMRFEWEKINILNKLTAMRFEWEKINILNKLPMPECDLKHGKASSHNFSKLEYLYLWNCHKLREIPIDFAEISTLKSIKLWKCLPSAMKSAKKIEDDQHDSRNYDMVAIEIEALDNVMGYEESLSEEES
nr:disease resistance protein RPP13-like isoform X2 [Ipomoea trifida]